VVIFNFFYIGLSWSHDLERGSCIPFFNNFFKIILFVFNFWIIIFILYGEIYFIKKNIYSEIIFFKCLALHCGFFLFILFNHFHTCLCFYYLLLILIKKFSRHKWVNISYYMIKYLDPIYLLISLIYLLIIVNNFFLFIYINDNQFIQLDAYTIFLIYTLIFFKNSLLTCIFFSQQAVHRWNS
jgi:hypothetical protein